MKQVRFFESRGGIESGSVSKWYKQAGDHVDSDDLLCTVKHSYGDRSVFAPAAGILSHVFIPEDAKVSNGSIVAVLCEPSEVGNDQSATFTPSGMGNQLFAEGYYAAARLIFKQQASDQDNDDWTKAVQGISATHCKEGNFGQAEKELIHYLTTRPASSELWYTLAEVLETQGKATKAYIARKKGGDLDPSKDKSGIIRQEANALDTLRILDQSPKGGWVRDTDLTAIGVRSSLEPSLRWKRIGEKSLATSMFLFANPVGVLLSPTNWLLPPLIRFVALALAFRSVVVVLLAVLFLMIFQFSIVERFLTSETTLPNFGLSEQVMSVYSSQENSTMDRFLIFPAVNSSAKTVDRLFANEVLVSFTLLQIARWTLWSAMAWIYLFAFIYVLALTAYIFETMLDQMTQRYSFVNGRLYVRRGFFVRRKLGLELHRVVQIEIRQVGFQRLFRIFDVEIEFKNQIEQGEKIIIHSAFFSRNRAETFQRDLMDLVLELREAIVDGVR